MKVVHRYQRIWIAARPFIFFVDMATGASVYK